MVVVEDSLRTDLSLAKKDEVARFAQAKFSSLSRSDQRRWAEVYLRGLLLGHGRKSVKRIAEEVLDLNVSQSLQQFINQSPWDWRLVRAEIADEVERLLEPRAWVIAETTIPKRGEHSVGVERRFVPSVGRAINCQLGIGLFLAGDQASIPVNWRIQLSPRWTEDHRRRDRAYIPAAVRSQQAWQYALDMVEEVADWGIGKAPVVGDLRHTPDADKLMSRLSELGMDFVFEVPDTFQVVPGPHLAAVRPTGFGPQRAPHLLRARDCLRGADVKHRQVVTWTPGVNGKHRATHAVAVPVRLPMGRGVVPLQLVGTSWQGGRQKLWLTNRTDLRAAEVITLGAMAERTETDLQDLRTVYGLLDFEGRSYRGWHHHMTLVSAAYTFAKLTTPLSQRVRRPS